MKTSTSTKLRQLVLVAVAALSFSPPVGALNLSQNPLFLTQNEPPLVLLTMARDHKLYYEAYDDHSDLTGDGVLDIGYKPDLLDYYGYFDSYKCYNYSSGVFVPASVTTNKKCSNKWSGDFLNYVTTSRMDALRKVLYGGKRSTDTSTQTILERSFIPQDAHAWGKEYESVTRDGYNITEYTPLSLPTTGYRHLFANVTLTSSASAPLMRVLPNSTYRIWEWVSIERPVAGSKCLNGGSGPACETAGGDTWEIVSSSYLSNLTQTVYTTNSASTIPASHSEYDTFVSTYATTANKCGSMGVSAINGSGNPFSVSPCNTGSDYYLNTFQGTLNITSAGTYYFSVDGDDAVEVIIDGTVVASWYNGHGSCNCNTYSGFITLTAGAHTIVYRHMEKTGGDNYYLRWKRTTPASTITDYTVRVEVCNASIGLEANCKTYGSTTPVYKPTNLLQQYGEDRGMYFALLTGSYDQNTQGGVLRKAFNKDDGITNEIEFSTGIYKESGSTCGISGTSPCVKGIIGTINRLMITSFNYANHEYSCGWITTRAMNNGECEMWGNPIAEMMYEGIRYFSGKTAATSSFVTSSTRDDVLLLPRLTSWTNPYASGQMPSCSKPYQMVISDVYPSFDSDSLPGADSNFAPQTLSDAISGLNVSTLGQSIWNNEFSSSKQIFIGQAGATYDGAPTAKTVGSFGNIRGLTPAEPTRQGSYYSASVAYYAHNNDLNTAAGNQKMSTYSVALSAPLPTIQIPVGSNTITIVPFAKSVGGSSISATQGQFQPTNQIVDFYVDTIKNVTTLNEDTSVNGGRPYYKFRINYEDVEQGADHDMDAIAVYEIKLNADNTVTVALTSEYAAGGIIQHMGYVISGTTRDGVYLVIRDADTASGSDPVYFLDCRATSNNPSTCVTGSGALPLYKELVFTANSTASSASFLKDPLWYAAKWGGFVDDNANDLPDTTEWDADGDGIPDNYFLVVNPLKMEQQLAKAFAKIKSDSGTAAALSTNSFSLQSNSMLYQARFSSGDWSGELNAYPIATDGSLGTATWQVQRKLATQDPNLRVILAYDPNATTKGIPFRWSSMTSNSTLQNSLNKNAAGTTDSKGSDRVTYLRGSSVTGFRTRPCVKGTSESSCIVNYLGDIINSAPQYVGAPSFGYADSTYRTFRTNQLSRTAMMYVGANDGMLHGFKADDGEERIAFVPSALYSNQLLSKLPAADYGKTTNPHHYYVDGTPTIGDVCTTNCTAATDWKTILVGGLNGGGQGIFALDVTNPTSFTEANAGTLVMWEFNDTNDSDLGYTYSRPAIVRICTSRDNSSSATPKTCSAYRWVVIFGNGYNNSQADSYTSTTGRAALYVLDALNGSLIKKITVDNTASAASIASPNGLATIAPYDADDDSVVDYVYAGDLRGNLWKFDLSNDTSSQWDSAFKSGSNTVPLYVAKDASNNLQPITISPEIIIHPDGGSMVLFGTGKYLEDSDKSSTSAQTIYGIWDKGAVIASVDRSQSDEALRILRVQKIATEKTLYDTNEYRTSSKYDVAWTTQRGWYIDLPDAGERVAYDPRVYGSVLNVTSLVPNTDACSAGGSSWDYFLDALTGKRLDFSAFDNVSMVTGTIDGNTVTAAASSRRSTTIGITPTGTTITTGKGGAYNYKGGSSGDIEKYKVNLGSNVSGRVSWRELTSD